MTIPPNPADSPPAVADRFVPELRPTRGLTPLAARAFCKALHLLGLAFATRLSELRADPEPLARAQAKVEEQAIIINALWDIIAVLIERMERIPDKRRPQHSPIARFTILRFGQVLNLSLPELARFASVSIETIARWQADLRSTDGEPRTHTVRPNPPIRRYHDVVEHLIQALALAGIKGERTIAALLARAGFLVSRSTVRRRLQKPVSVPPPEPTGSAKRSVPSGLTAKRPNHIWIADISVVRGLFGLSTFHVAAILDVYSRLPLVAQVFASAPTSADIARLFRSAARALGTPSHFITDQGTQFTGKAFKKALERKGVRHRYGAIGAHGSIAIIERFWQTMKRLLGVRFWKPLLAADLEQRLDTVLLFYSVHRPHSSLAGATPLEVFTGTTPACQAAVRPPLATARDAPTLADFRITHIDKEQRLPVLARVA